VDQRQRRRQQYAPVIEELVQRLWRWQYLLSLAMQGQLRRLWRQHLSASRAGAAIVEESRARQQKGKGEKRAEHLHIYIVAICKGVLPDYTIPQYG